MNITPRPIIPASLKFPHHFRGQVGAVYINTFGTKSIKIHPLKVFGERDKILSVGLGTKSLNLSIEDPALLGMDEFAHLKIIADRHSTYQSFDSIGYINHLQDLDADYVCTLYYLRDLKNRHGSNIDMELLFEAIHKFTFPK